MSDLQHYFTAQLETKLARTEYALAAKKIELCQIKERAAEMRSQHLPLADYVGTNLSREGLLEIVNYLMRGRKDA